MNSTKMLALAAAIAGAITAPASSVGGQPRATVDYSNPSRWICLPGRKDACSAPLPTTALNPNGYGSTGQSTVAADPQIDCFYIYPTVSNDDGLNSDLNPGRDERLMVETQFARFASVCRPFAPVYRQMTVASIAAYATGGDVTAAGMLAYGDVLAAWRNYWRTRNDGRPFVLIGHSQGSLMLQQLIAREIEKNPAQLARMKLAIVPGYDLLVPIGKRVGGTFKKVPLCASASETGCAIAWSSFREHNVPPPGAMFGYSDQPGMTVACVNPALPGSRRWVPLDSYWFTPSTLAVPGGPIAWSSEGKPPSAYVRTPGLVSGKCVNDGPRGYLSIRTDAHPGDKRTDRVGGEVSVFDMFLPGWGMHLADISEAQGDLVRAVGAISDRSRTIARHRARAPGQA